MFSKKIIFRNVILLLGIIAIIMVYCFQDFNDEKDPVSQGNNANIGINRNYIGQTVKNSSNVEFTVLEVYDTTKIGFNHITEYNFIVITLQIENKGSSPWSQNPNNCKLNFNDAVFEYNVATYYFDDGMTSWEEINPQISKTMKIVFETPTKSVDDTYILKLSSSFGLNAISIYLKDNSSNE